MWDKFEQDREAERIAAQLTALAITGRPHAVPKVGPADYGKRFAEQSF